MVCGFSAVNSFGGILFSGVINGGDLVPDCLKQPSLYATASLYIRGGLESLFSPFIAPRPGRELSGRRVRPRVHRGPHAPGPQEAPWPQQAAVNPQGHLKASTGVDIALGVDAPFFRSL